MDICLVPSLQHLSCTKLVTSLFNKVLPLIDITYFKYSEFLKSKYPKLRDFRDKEFRKIESQVTRDITNLISCVSLQKKLENFIAPLFRELEKWLNTCYQSLLVKDETCYVIMYNIPQCWLTDGTIDREKSAKLVVENNNILRINRFMFACTYCSYEDVLNLWELLSETEKDKLQKYSDFVVKQWITWLKSRSNKDWLFCVAWILGTSLWTKNRCVLKRVLEPLTPAEKSHCLRKVLTGTEVSSDFMLFCLSLMTRYDQELIFRESPVEVFRCISSWPLRSSFFDIADNLWPYLTQDSFCCILNMLLRQVKNHESDYFDLLIILKKFWSQSPHNFQTIAKDDGRFSRPLQCVLDFDVSQTFPKQEFSDYYLID
uniref:Uncharacterized protein n=2 Tax=Araneus ventricosus TaxID=182803 RepID=A0A4Y2KX38_ARAVE|nr:hypothetical protein AVEN_245632-1 [Araneus ventricosus]GBN06951.1 hypothetical protein AVEN_153667-1 [Araneus ventricosus]